MNVLVLATAAAESGEVNVAPYIAGGIAAAIFIISAVVLRSFRDVVHRSADPVAPAADRH